LEISKTKEKLAKLLANNATESPAFADLENKLKIIQDRKIREQMQDWKISEILNVEKPSKHFLDIEMQKKQRKYKFGLG
jgi:hypothetical protein